MQSDNPFKSPETDDTYVDPGLHAELRRQYALMEEDVKAAVNIYIREDPWLMLAVILTFAVPILFLAFLEELFGFTSQLPVLVAVVMLFAAAFSVRYLASIPIRLEVERKLRTNQVLGVGWKSIRIGPKSICIETKSIVIEMSEQTEFDLREVVARGTVKQHYLLLVLNRHEILIIPHHAFAGQRDFRHFEKMVKKRLRRLRGFWTLRC